MQAQRTSFNTLDNWGHKTPTDSKKRKDDRKEKVKGSWPGTYTIQSVTLIKRITRIAGTAHNRIQFEMYMPF